MKNLKNKIIVLLLIMFVPFIVNASSASVSIKCDKSLVSAGDTAKCTLSMTNSGDINGLQGKFDLGELSYVGFTPASGAFNTQNMNASGFTVGNTAGLPSSLTVGTLEVKVPAGASAGQKFTITINGMIASNTEYEDVDVSNASATVKIASNDTALKSLDVTGLTMTPTFQSGTVAYSIDSTTNERVTITAVPNSDSAKVSGTGEKTLKYGKNSFNIVVTSESGAKKTYTININRIDDRDTDNTLKYLNVEGQTIVPTFISTVKEYTVDVASDVTTAKIDCGSTSDKATFVNKFGPRTVNLKYGRNEVQIQVKAENEKVNTYKVIINRKDNRDSNNNLLSLEVSEGNIKFNKDTTSYTINVTNDITKIDIKAEAESDKATVTGTGNKTLKDGSNKFVVEVKAENEIVKKYTIIVVKASKDAKAEEIKKFINTLSIKNADIEFDPNVEDYELKLKEGDKLELEYELPDGITAEVVGNENLNNGGSVKLVLVSKDGETKIYSFNINKEEVAAETEENKEDTPKEESKFPLWIIIAAVAVVAFIVVACILGKKKNDNNNQNGNMPSNGNNGLSEQPTVTETNNNVQYNANENTMNTTSTSENVENNQNQLY